MRIKIDSLCVFVDVGKDLIGVSCIDRDLAIEILSLEKCFKFVKINSETRRHIKDSESFFSIVIECIPNYNRESVVKEIRRITLKHDRMAGIAQPEKPGKIVNLPSIGDT